MPRAQLVEFLANGMRDTSGQPLAAGKVYTYSAGTSSNKATYTAPDKAAGQTNPVILDSNGRALVYGDGNYRFVVKTSADVTLYDIDNAWVGLGAEAIWAGTSGGSANAQTLTPSPALPDYYSGMTFAFTPGASNTGAVTLNVNGLGAKGLKKGGSSNLSSGDLAAGTNAVVVYDGSQFQLLGGIRPATTWTPAIAGSGSMTVSSVTTAYATYRREGNWVYVVGHTTFTTGGTAAPYVTLTLPLAAASIAANQVVALGITDTGLVSGYGQILNGTTSMRCYKYDASNYGIGASRDVYMNFSYLCT